MWILDDRLGFGIDLQCPAVSLEWHRCHKFFYVSFYPFWFNFSYGKFDDEEKSNTK